MPDNTAQRSADHFDFQLQQCRHVVAVLFPLTLETSDDSIALEIPRGLHHFSTFKKARAFAHACNSGLDEPVAYHFRNSNTLAEQDTQE